MSKLLERMVNTPLSILKGLRITMRNMGRTKVTQLYPEMMPTPTGRGLDPRDPTDAFDKPYEIAPRFRGLHGLTRDPETGDHNCIGCMACANVCPDDLISMDLEKREGHNGRYPVTFNVNIGPCCFCGLCAEVCPTPMRAIVMTDLFEWAAYERFGVNLVLNREDLERNGDYEVARRAGGRTFGPDGELLAILPEEEGNPYFQFAIESGKADRMAKKADKDAAKSADKPAEPPAAPEAPAAPAVDPMIAVRERFTAAGLPVPEDVVAFDLESLDTLVDDRKTRASLKSAIMKARKTAGGEAVAAPAPTAEAPAESASPETPPPPPPPPPPPDARAVLRDLFTAAGLPVPEDVMAFELESLDGIEDRKLRGSLKSAVMKARKAEQP
jgi:NADH-quinone oxidoreductase subunit I